LTATNRHSEKITGKAGKIRMTRQAQKNNRWCPRQPVHLDVTLHISGQFPFCGKILNVSLGGLFVETDTTRLVGDAEVYVAFTLRTNTGTRHHRMPARSIRQNGNGVALLFTALDTGDIQGLRQLVYPAPAGMRAPSPGGVTHLRRPAA
jgi:PilZ domain